MPRIPQAQIEERNAFLLELIRNQPDISRDEAQERFEEKFDATLNPKTFQQLREQVEQEQRSAPAAAAEEPSHEEDTDAADSKPSNGAAESSASNGNGAAAQPAKVKVKAKGAKNVFVDAPKEQLVFLEQIVQQLQAAGASNVRIDHSTDRWMVLVVDAK